MASDSFRIISILYRQSIDTMARGEFQIFTRYTRDNSLRRAGPCGLISYGVEKICERLTTSQ
jgi:hypothetical protein